MNSSQEKTSVKRSDIKSNILNKIVVTFEYSGLNNLKDDIIEIIKRIDNEFVSYDVIKFQDTNIDISQFLYRNFKIGIQEIADSDCFIFNSIDENESLVINKFFIQYNIKCDKYKKFTHYRDIFTEVIVNLKRVTKFYKPIRLSHRKINLCIIKDLSKIYDYFESEYYSSPYLKKLSCNNEDDDELLSWESSTKLNRKNFEFGLINHTSTGYYKDNLAIRIIADIKGNADEEILKNEKDYRSLLDNLNEEIFNIFKNVLTIGFLKEMIDKSWNEEIIEGVESNE